MGRLDQKVALITGGARGIGRQMALHFAREGADIVIGDVIEMESAAGEVKNLGRDVVTVRTDLTRGEQVEALINAAIDHFNKLDILVNNAGVLGRKPTLEMDERYWDTVLNVNLRGVFFCTQAAAKHMIPRKYGKIINIASVGGLPTYPVTDAAYAVSKAGVIRLTMVYARTLGPHGINVNAIAPGPCATDMVVGGSRQMKRKKSLKTRLT